MLAQAPQEIRLAWEAMGPEPSPIPEGEARVECPSAGLHSDHNPSSSQENKEQESLSHPEDEIRAEGLTETVTTAGHASTSPSTEHLVGQAEACHPTCQDGGLNPAAHESEHATLRSDRETLRTERIAPEMWAWEDQASFIIWEDRAPFITDTHVVKSSMWTGPAPTFDLATPPLAPSAGDAARTEPRLRATTTRNRKSTSRGASVAARSQGQPAPPPTAPETSNQPSVASFAKDEKAVPLHRPRVALGTGHSGGAPR